MKWLILSLLISHNAHAGGAVGNGGDAIVCRSSKQNNFAGYYSLDYLAKYQTDLEIIQAKSFDQALDRIEKGLKEKLPELAKNFREYRQNLFNKTDFTKKQIWEESPFGLVDLKDEALVDLLPENCTESGKAYVIQAAIRQPPAISGLPEYKVKYKFVSKVIEELKKQNPVQLSFLVLHEWLWDFSKNVERNRKINYWLHSINLEKWTRAEWQANLNGIGFALPGRKIPVWEESICQPDLNSLNLLRQEDHSFVMGKGQLYSRLEGCKSEKCGFNKDSEEFRKLFGKEVTLHLNWAGWINIKSPGSEDQYITCLFDEVTGKGKECRYRDYTEKGDTKFLVDFTPVFGADCVTLRGQVFDYSNVLTEEYVFYFSNVKFRGN